MQNRWLYIDFNSYFASVEQQLNPALRGKPIAVVPVDTDATCAIAASYEAKAFGVKTGTPIYEAKRMCKNLICVLAQHEAYVDFHHRILAEIDRHIPVTDVCSIDEVACQLMDNENSFEQATALAKKIKAGLYERVGAYMKCSIGVAPNRYLAKVASDFQKPDGLTFISASDIPQKLYSLKLRDLPGIGANMEERLKNSRITDMTDLYRLDLKQIRKAWGSVLGERMWYALRGIDLPDPETHRRSIGHSHVLAPEFRSPEKAALVAKRLILKAAMRLRRIGYVASSVSLGVRLEEGIKLETARGCHQISDSFTFLHLLDEMWKELLKKMDGSRIKKIGVAFHQLTETSALQLELFQAPTEKGREKKERLSSALDQINHRYGRDKILLGMIPQASKGFSGTKIAFTRIPEVEEFLE